MITLKRCTITTTRITRITTSEHNHQHDQPVNIVANTTSLREINRGITKTHYHTSAHEHRRAHDSRGRKHTRTARNYIPRYVHTITRTPVTQATRIRSICVWPLARSIGIQIRYTDLSWAHELPESQPNKPQPLNTSTRDYHRDYKIRDIHHSTHTQCHDHTTKR